MRIVAIDPGNERSALVNYFGGPIVGELVLAENEAILQMLPGLRESSDVLAIEMVACYGMPVGKEVFETCVWIGRFIDRWGKLACRVYRKDVKMHLCHSMRATDANIRAALLDRFGPGKQKAVGMKKAPGPLYGIKKDLWSALAVAVYWSDLHDNENGWKK